MAAAANDVDVTFDLGIGWEHTTDNILMKRFMQYRTTRWIIVAFIAASIVSPVLLVWILLFIGMEIQLLFIQYTVGYVWFYCDYIIPVTALQLGFSLFNILLSLVVFYLCWNWFTSIAPESIVDFVWCKCEKIVYRGLIVWAKYKSRQKQSRASRLSLLLQQQTQLPNDVLNLIIDYDSSSFRKGK
jgi:hypothetical protein